MHPELPLKPWSGGTKGDCFITPEQQAVKWSALMANEQIRKKCDRERRLREHWEYVDKWLPEITDPNAPRGVVIDVGPGMGELLEIARFHGHDAQGIDAHIESSEMGPWYARAARLMHERQGLHVAYTSNLMFGLAFNKEDWVGKALAVNMRGSVEQAMAPCMLGVPHREHHDCKQLRWDMPRATEQLDEMMAAFAELLRPGGVLMIHANGCAVDGPGNVHDYDSAIIVAASGAGLKMVAHVPPTIHKFQNL